jgi:hypothetical protein
MLMEYFNKVPDLRTLSRARPDGKVDGAYLKKYEGNVGLPVLSREQH